MDEIDRTDWPTEDIMYEIHCSIVAMEMFVSTPHSEEALWVLRTCQKIEKLKKELLRRARKPSVN